MAQGRVAHHLRWASFRLQRSVLGGSMLDEPTPSDDRLRVLEGHTDAVFGVCALVVDGRALLAAASSDQTVALWDAATGERRMCSMGGRPAAHRHRRP